MSPCVSNKNTFQYFRFSLLFVLTTLLSGRAQSASPAFEFTQSDEELLREANDIDQQFEKKGLIYHNPEIENYLDSIAGHLVGDDTPPQRVVYKFRVIRDPMVNAFALPNGSIYVNSGLVAALENEAQLAGVMSHEITHVIHRHSYLQNRSIRKKVMTMNVLQAIGAGGGYFPAGSVFGTAIQSAATVSQILVVTSVYGYSQNLERDADQVGLSQMTRANYDPSELVRSFEILDEKLEYEPIEPFWRTHPKLQERIATAKVSARAQKPAEPYKASESDYMSRMAQVIRYNIELDLESRRARTAVARANRLVKWDPNVANTILLADTYRTLGAKTPEPEESERSPGGQQVVRRRMLKMTAEEEQKDLLKISRGSETLKANRTRAEELYKEAISKDPQTPDAHRGLGMLYADEGKISDAATEYRDYLALAPSDAPDRLRIERRLQNLNEHDK